MLPRFTGMLLAGAPVLFGALEGPFLPVAGDIAVVGFTAAQIWFGASLVRGGQSGDGAARPSAPSRSRSSAEMR